MPGWNGRGGKKLVSKRDNEALKPDTQMYITRQSLPVTSGKK